MIPDTTKNTFSFKRGRIRQAALDKQRRPRTALGAGRGALRDGPEADARAGRRGRAKPMTITIPSI